MSLFKEAHWCLKYRQEQEQSNTRQVLKLWKYLREREAEDPTVIRIHLGK